MPDTYSSFLQVRLPAVGAYDNTWGSTLNTDAFALIDAAVTGLIAIAIGTSVSVSLPALTQGGASNSRYLTLRFTGTPAGQVTVTLDPTIVNKQYIIDNQTGQALKFTYGSGRVATVPAGSPSLAIIWCDQAGPNVDLIAQGNVTFGALAFLNTADAAHVSGGVLRQASLASGVVRVQQGGAPSGGSDGDITLIY